MIESILKEQPALARHRAAPLLREREQFLSHLVRQGTRHDRVRSIAAYLIHIVRLLELASLRNVELEEIKTAGECWARYKGPHRQKRAGISAAYCFTNVARKWFRFHGRLTLPKAPACPFSEFVHDFVEWMRSRQGLSPATVKAYSHKAGVFLTWLAGRQKQLSLVSLNDVDEFLADKAALGWQPSTLASQAQALRAFFEHAARRGWCAPGIGRGIRSSAAPKYDGKLKGPSWKEVRRLLRATQGTEPATLRARAILFLCSIYALRSSEVVRLRLSAFDWRDEEFSVHRAKRGGVQHYPIQYEVGEAILQYLKRGRPRCPCRHVFVTLHPPYRPVAATSLWQLTSRRMRQLKIDSAHHGPHALRHACATHLLRKGTSLKQIAEFLGHRDLKSVGIYAKYDTRSLRKVADFRLAGLR